MIIESVIKAYYIKCDGKSCSEMITIPVTDYMLELNDEITKRGWLIVDDKHYCSNNCGRIK